jgi:hypothetical protein
VGYLALPGASLCHVSLNQQVLVVIDHAAALVGSRGRCVVVLRTCMLDRELRETHGGRVQLRTKVICSV